ncbi:hypothetical protein C2W62_48820 [Candidatus Entotheonella serta]|nr:hypothetical protein C2W62_48820 [Candidatus Entotheonella serta]
MSDYVEQHLGLTEIRGIKAFGKPVVYWGEKSMTRFAFPLILPKTAQAKSGTQLQRFGVLTASHLCDTRSHSASV